MPMIRLGIVGLSGNISSWAGAAHLPYLLSPHGRAHYNIVAVCNSTIDSARSAIERFGLSSDTRAYGNPTDLAQDANVDLVVCSTRVDRHYETIKPSICAGKAVFIEWPLASNITQARELVSLANNKNIESIIGLQGPVTAPINAVRKLLEGSCIGNVISSSVKAWGGVGCHDTVPESLRYFTQMAVGVWEFLQSALGDVYDVRSTLQLQQPRVSLTSTSGIVVETVESDVPDLVSLAASLRPNAYISDSASIIITFYRGKPPSGEPSLTWTITGEKGKINITAEGGTTPRTMASKPVNIAIHHFGTGEIRDITWAWDSWIQELPVAARGVAAVYEAFAKGDRTGYRDLNYALKRAEQLQNILFRC
ncbi:Galactose/lactose metabolism regulatory protein GAL80 [Fusarium oxysporum f. sp. cubense]|uniref:Galactose/lactose metabolism regulatory protein GAL80 n=1 Tax=Fusarium oxysporum f. sp. cubense TaxID=61366 RepID=A0A559LSR7_FUSOC|nr:Galactose/lactose metabolism regulatory protein GAL80 [Fusarium oxysporum f. sp. cubense]